MRLATDKDCASATAIADTLRWRIANGSLAPNAKLPVRQDMAREFNAALATMQRAIDQLVAEGFISCTPGKGTFVHPEPPSKADVALVFGSAISTQSLFCKALRSVAGSIGAISAVEKVHPYRLRTFELHGDQRDSSINTLATLVSAHRLAGIIVVSPTSDILAALDHTTAACVPLVLIGSEGRNYPKFPRVEVDQDSFAAAAIGLLHRRGRRRIAHLLADGMQGYDDTASKLRELQCEDTPHLVQFIGEGRRWRGAEHIAHLLMHLPASERPNGIVIHDDNLVSWASLGLRASGVRIPEDLDVVIHANLPSQPVCVVPASKLGFDAADVLESALNLLSTKHAQTPGPTVVQVKQIP